MGNHQTVREMLGGGGSEIPFRRDSEVPYFESLMLLILRQAVTEQAF